MRAYLLHFFSTADNTQPFQKYFQESYLKQLFYTAKLLKGEKVADIETVLDKTTIETLTQSKEIDIGSQNQQFFGPGDEVTLQVDVKNIQRLTVKAFEIKMEH